MYKLILFLSNNRNAFLFLILEVIAFMLVINYNDRQRHALGDSLLETSSKVYTQRATVEGYFGLQKRNKELMQLSKRLQLRVDSLQRMVDLQEGWLLKDSSFTEQQAELVTKERFEYLPCRAIRNTTHKAYNYITLDKGTAHGVKKGMGLISPQGVVGKVIRVSEHYSLALSALNVSFKLSVKVEGEGNVGIYEWEVGDPAHAKISYIPQNVELAEQDRVFTAGSNTIFPEGVLVGTIDQINKENQGGYYDIRIELATNFYDLDHLFLIVPEHNDALDSLEVDLIRD